MQSRFADYSSRAKSGDARALEWVELFRRLGEHLSMRVD
jgi:hypothetical protein